MKKLAAFDVDGTLTFTDSFMLFLRYYSGRKQFFINMALLIPTFILYILKIIDRDTAKTNLLEIFFKNKDYKEYRQKAQDFARIAYPLIVRKDGLDAIKQHLANGDEVSLVSASLVDYLEFWAPDLGIKHVIATRLEVKDDKLTGKMDGPNCRAEIKLSEIRKHFPDYEIIAAYGDSRGDKEMIEAATNPYYRKLKDEPSNAKAIKNNAYFGDLLD